jgi:hypothetical protein
MRTRDLSETTDDRRRRSLDRPDAWLSSIDTVWIAVAIALSAIIAMASRIIVIDLAYHIRAGEQMLSTASIARTDTFSFIDPGRAWLNQQWGAQVIFGALYRVGGFATISFARSVAMAALATFLFLSCRARGADRRVSAVLTSLGTLLVLESLGVRPQLFGLLLFAVALWILMTRSTHPGRLWALPPTALIWANVHGSFVLLIPVLVLVLVDAGVRRQDDFRRLLLVSGLSLGATILTPFGPDAWRYVLELTSNPVVRDRVTEWAPLTIRNPIGIMFFASVGAVVFALVRRAEWVTWVDLLWLATFFAVGITAVRSAAWWGFIAPVILAGILPRGRPEGSGGSALINSGFLLAIAASAVLLLPWWNDIQLVAAPQHLVVATEEATVPGARLMVHQTYASWFELALPDRPVFVDSRIELYPETVWADYEALIDGRSDWPEIVDRWQADAIVTDRSWTLIPFLRTSPSWRLAFENRDGFVFVRA